MSLVVRLLLLSVCLWVVTGQVVLAGVTGPVGVVSDSNIRFIQVVTVFELLVT